MFPNLTLAEFVEINPKVTIPKGKEVPFVEMGDISPGRRYVASNSLRKFTGNGSKFSSGDILFARITPCLENGKVAQYKAPQGTIGFGSTEFFVFRNKEGISDSSYVYYLLRSDIIRAPAIKSMSGASGRQRADLSIVSKIEIRVPPLATQRKIAAILSAYDDLIENNNRRIKILEEMAQLIYREWFVKFRFPGYEKVRMVDSELGPIPEGWEVKKLGDVLELAYGKALKKNERRKGTIPVFGSSGVIGYHDEYLVKGPGIIVGRKGNVGSVFWSNENFYPIDTVFYVITELNLPYCYYALKEQNFINNDSAVPGLSRNQAYLNRIVVPTQEILQKYNDHINPIFSQLYLLDKKNLILRRTRDLLLPKLISGELNVEDLDIAVGGD